MGGADNKTCTPCNQLGVGASLCAGPKDIPSSNVAEIT